MSNTLNIIAEVKNISKIIGSKKIIDNISLKLYEGEILSILGPSGSGKTTLVSLILGLILASEGSIEFPFCQDLKYTPIHYIGYMGQSDALYEELTIKEHLDYFASLYNLTKNDKQKRSEELLELVQLTPYLKTTVKNFSGGMKKRLSLIIALLHSPKVLILDEPTVGIDPLLRQKFWHEFNALKKKGCSIVLTTHLMDEVSYSDRVVFLREGKTLAEGNPFQLIKDLNKNNIEEVFLHYITSKKES